MIFRVRFATRGGHIHCRLFVAEAQNMTFAKCGDFVVNKGEEFRDLLEAFSRAEFIPDEGETTGIAEAVKP